MPNANKTTERIPFHLIHMECCHQIICHVNHRLPMYCSGCGAFVFPQVKGWIRLKDEDARMVYDCTKTV